MSAGATVFGTGLGGRPAGEAASRRQGGARPAQGQQGQAAAMVRLDDAWRLRSARRGGRSADCRTSGTRPPSRHGAGRRIWQNAAPRPGQPAGHPRSRPCDRCAKLLSSLLDWYLGCAGPGRLPAGSAAHGDGEFHRPAAERVRDPAGGPPRLHPRQDVAHRRRRGRNARLVGRRERHVLGVAAARPAAADALRPLPAHHAGEDRKGRGVVGALRHDGRVHLAPAAGDPPPDRHPRRHRASQLLVVLARDGGRLGAVVHRARLGGRHRRPGPRADGRQRAPHLAVGRRADARSSARSTTSSSTATCGAERGRDDRRPLPARTRRRGRRSGRCRRDASAPTAARASTTARSPHSRCR